MLYREILAAIAVASLLDRCCASPSSKGVLFPFDMPVETKSKEKALSMSFATEQEFQRQCFGFIYEVVGDVQKVTKESLSRQLPHLCHDKHGDHCNVWATELWSVVEAKKEKRQGKSSYSKWCSEVYHSQGGTSTSVKKASKDSVVSSSRLRSAASQQKDVTADDVANKVEALKIKAWGEEMEASNSTEGGMNDFENKLSQALDSATKLSIRHRHKA